MVFRSCSICRVSVVFFYCRACLEGFGRGGGAVGGGSRLFFSIVASGFRFRFGRSR